MAQLFTILFFAAVLGTAIAILWSVVDENRAALLANRPWKVRGDRQPYWATPSMRVETPSRPMTVSPATVR